VISQARLYPVRLLAIALALSALSARLAAAADDRPLTAQQQEQLRQADSAGEQANKLYAEAKYGEARAALEKKVALERQALGVPQARLAGSLAYLVVVQERLGDYAAAQRTTEEWVGIQTKLEGENHWRTANAVWVQKRCERLASLSADEQRRFQEARRDVDTLADLDRQQKDREGLERGRQALAVYRELLPPGHPEVAVVLLWLGSFRESLGEHDEAERLYQEAAAVQKAATGEVHPEYAQALNHLGLLAHRVGDEAAAESYLRRAAEIARQASGESDPAHAKALSHLAWLYNSLGDQARAEPLYRQSKDVYRKTPGPQSPECLGVVNSLAALYDRVATRAETHEDFAAAAAARRQAVTVLEEQFGDRHWRSADARWALDRVERRSRFEREQRRRLDEAADLMQQIQELEAEKKFREAIVLARRAEEVTRVLLGDAHPDHAGCLTWLGWLHYQVEEYPRSIASYEQALKEREKTLGADHPDSATTLNHLGLTHEYAEDLRQAEAHYRRAVAVFDKARGGQHADTLTVHGNLVRVLEKRARRDEEREDFPAARQARQEVLNLQTDRYGANTPKARDARWALARVEHLAALGADKRRRLLEADAAMQKVQELHRQNQLRPALASCRQARDIRKEVLGTDHLDYAATVSWLGALHYKLDEFDQAEPCLREAEAVYRQVLGEDHPTSVERLRNLGAVYDGLVRVARGREDFSAVRDAQQKLLEVRIRQHGVNHPAVTWVRLELKRTERPAALDPAQRRRLDEADRDLEQAAALNQQQKYREALTRARQAAEVRKELLGDEDTGYADALHAQAWAADGLGEGEEAARLYRQTADIQKKVLGTEEPAYITSIHNLGTVYLMTLKDPGRAEPLLREVYQLSRKVHGETYRDTVNTLGALAQTTSELAVRAETAGDFSAARRHRRALVTLVTRLRGAGHWQVTDARLAVARLELVARLSPEERRRLEEADNQMKQARQLSDAGDARAALRLVQQALEVRKELLGAGHADVATSLHWLAFLSKNSGQLERAFELYLQALALRARILGADHPDYAITLNNLGMEYVRKEEYARAEPLLRQALQARKQALGTGHADYATSLHNLGWLYDNMKDYARAEPFYRQALAVKQKVNGACSPSYLTTLNNLALLCEKKGDLAQAELLLRQVLALREQVQGSGHAQTTRAVKDRARVCALLADAREREERFAEARTLRGEVVTLRVRLDGEEHWQVADARRAQERLGRLEKLTTDQRRRLRDADQLLRQLDELAVGDVPAALPRMQQALAARRELLGDEHAETASAWHMLGVLWEKVGDLVQAESATRQAVAIRRKALGERHPDYALSLHNQGVLLGRLENQVAALPLLRQAVQVRKQTLGEKHQYVKDSLTALTDALKGFADERQKHEDFAEAWRALLELADVQTAWRGAGHWRVTDARQAAAHVDLLARLTPEQRCRLEEASRLSRESGRFLDEDKERAALEPARRALEIRKEVLGEQHRATADSLSRLAQVHFALQDHKAAEPLCLQALEVRRRQLGEEHPDYAISLGDLAVIYSETGSSARGETYLRRAATILMKWHGQGDTIPFDSLKNAALVYEEIAGMYRDAEDYAAARRAYQELLDLRTRLHGAAHPEVKEARLLLQDIDLWERLQPQQRTELKQVHELTRQIRQLWLQEKYAEALPLARQAAEGFRKYLGDKHRNYALCLFNLGRQLEGLGRLEEAEEPYRQAAIILLEALGAEHSQTRMVLEQRVDLAGQRGTAALRDDDLATARRVFQERLDLQRQLSVAAWQLTDARLAVEYVAALAELSPEQRHRLAEADRLLTQAWQLYREGRYRDCLEPARRAEAIRREMLGDRHPQHTQAVLDLANLYNVTGHPALAEPLLPAVLAAFQKALGEAHPDYATVLGNLGYARMLLGDLAGAEPLLRRALEVRGKVRGEDSAAYAVSLQSLGRLYRLRGDFSRSRSLLQQALDTRRQALGEDADDYGASLYHLGALLVEMGDIPEAEKLARQALQVRRQSVGEQHPHYADSLELLARLARARGDAPGAESLARQAAAIRKQRLGEEHPDYADSLQLLGLLARDRADWAGAEALLRESARVSRRYLEAAAAGASPGGQLSLVRSLRGRLDAYLALARERRLPPEQVYTEVLAWKGALFVRQQQLAAARQGQQAAGSLESAPPTAEQVRATLPSGAALVDFLEYDAGTAPAPEQRAGSGPTPGARLTAFVVRPGAPIFWLDLGPAAVIAADVERWCAVFRTRGSPAEQSATAGAALRRQLWEPLQPALEGITVLLVSPDGNLGRAPLGALPGKRPGHYLLEEMAVAYLTPRALATRPATAPGLTTARPVSMLLVADDAPRASTRRPNAERAIVSALFLRSYRGAELGRLNGGEALVAGLRARAGGPDFLHLVVPDLFVPPQRDRPQGEGGLLTVPQVVEMNLTGTRLAVLSGPDTGRGEPVRGEGVVGMPRAFHVAGVSNILSSLGQVDQESTEWLMSRFYANLWRERLSPVQALRQAQVGLLPASPAVPRGEALEPAGALPPSWAPWVLSGTIEDLTRPLSGWAGGTGAEGDRSAAGLTPLLGRVLLLGCPALMIVLWRCRAGRS
jgi:hypothetical protein